MARARRPSDAADTDPDRESAQRVAAAADELYGRPLVQFVSARAELAKAARAAGDAAAARQIGTLTKPNAVAWLANQLVRAHGDEVAALVDLGAQLRDATAELDAERLRSLATTQRRAIAELVAQARRLGAAADQRVTDQTARGLEETLHAALADPDAAAELQGARLSAALSASGFPGLTLTAAAPPARKAATRTAATTTAKKAATKAATKAASKAADTKPAADAERSAARADHRDALDARKQAQREVTGADRAAQRAAAEVERRYAELEDARAAQNEADKAHRRAIRALADADRALRQAAARVDRAGRVDKARTAGGRRTSR